MVRVRSTRSLGAARVSAEVFAELASGDRPQPPTKCIVRPFPSEIGNMPVTAIFDTRDAEAALATIAETLPVRVLNGSGWVTVVTRQ